MNVYEPVSSRNFMLNEQIARQVFEVLPEQGPLMLIMDRDGNSWPSDSAELAKLDISESFLKELCAKIDDGAEPVVTQVNDCSIIAAQLATDQSNCGYVIIALPQYSPESTLININLIEIVLNQLSLIARLIEKSNLLYEVQMKQYRLCSDAEAISN
ncbi:MAG: hypothetical protein ABIF19_15875 [Planctomycetota bacterium]